MARVEGRTLSLNEVSQTIDASEVLGVDVSNEPRIVQEFGQAVLDTIIERTEAGRDVNGRSFRSYDPDYIESEDFDEFGKSPNEVNMTQTGDMMDSIDFTTSGSTVKVAVGAGVDTLKAYNHNVGDTLPKREFFGVNQSELASIKRRFRDDIARLNREGSTDEPIRAELFTAASFIDTVNTTQLFSDVFGDLLDG